ncbi:MAG TPA: GDP-mannose 4,6-dehydratase [Candidatus Ratteibacteria bacterium]|jgi:nucleoside-diphosphate-sugar epimerase|uniref:UDP-glucose 4-epimerase n=1 Tax=candidate division TA06 bacterium ADurb.Bin131 TaxID=1852827 RepID=A0A1V6C444_UNCT6|nr:MAG: UDP-glucose 4-epimerase [candidate division TA06 bacterium ADurb.Bin131]HOC03254.1 GDP-mannose 4,6-dehydratase [bacterium]HRS06687.1 GDP-mannose 4,6-dehydratase [Candidatus Ratteibacteria bacterium]HON05643.1 GDP-mannose 4,6-dehydratase [bacterium]HPC30044.1 GDP-mannose 4,6-dehydratase [bacterium]
MRILLTGCAGFIGWQTAKMALSSGYDVIGIDDINDYYDVRLKNWRLDDLIKTDGFEFRQIDIRNKNQLEKLFSDSKPDAIINLAARAGVRASIENPHIYFETNVLGNLNLLTLAEKFKIKKFILASTSSLYAGQSMPFSETLPVNTPISPYAASKKSAEVSCYTYHYLYDIDVSIFRYFTVYGPAGRPDLSIFKFIKLINEEKEITVYGDGNQSRDFTFVEDIARGTLLGLKDVGFEIINLGGNHPYTINETISLIEKYLGKKAKVINKPFPQCDIPATWADISKAKKILNWQPIFSLEEGIKKTIDWCIENKNLVEEIVLKD